MYLRDEILPRIACSTRYQNVQKHILDMLNFNSPSLLCEPSFQAFRMMVKVEVLHELLIKEICQRSVRPEKGGGEPVHMLLDPCSEKSTYR